MVITLIGFRGTGKSSVGPQLAARLGIECIDADEEITHRADKSIPDIFESDGEPHFRMLEASVLSDLLHREHLVIAAGGGAVMDDITRMRMREAGPVVWLQARLETILQRIGDDVGAGGNRPSLTDHDPKTEMELLLNERYPLYADTASIVVSTDDRNVTSIVDEIVSQLPPHDEEEE